MARYDTEHSSVHISPPLQMRQNANKPTSGILGRLVHDGSPIDGATSANGSISSPAVSGVSMLSTPVAPSPALSSLRGGEGSITTAAINYIYTTLC